MSRRKGCTKVLAGALHYSRPGTRKQQALAVNDCSGCSATVALQSCTSNGFQVMDRCDAPKTVLSHGVIHKSHPYAGCGRRVLIVLQPACAAGSLGTNSNGCRASGRAASWGIAEERWLALQPLGATAHTDLWSVAARKSRRVNGTVLASSNADLFGRPRSKQQKRRWGWAVAQYEVKPWLA